MDKSMTIKAGDIHPDARQWVAGVLHVNLADDDELTLELHRKAESRRDERREAARRRLLGALARMDDKSHDVSNAEMEGAIEEAMRFVRPSAGE